MNAPFRNGMLGALLVISWTAAFCASVGLVWAGDLPPAPPLSAARSWGYQLQKSSGTVLDPAIDVFVTDYSRDGSTGKAWTPADLINWQLKPDGSRRIVLSYMSIGEAERYRWYWNSAWDSQPPAWLGAENPEWKGNYLVKYWDDAWKSVLLGPTVDGGASYLDRIIDAGFDGVYLDRVDAFDEWKTSDAAAASRMKALVREIADHARKRRPGFLVVPQNAEELLADPAYRKVIDGIAKEDLFFGVGQDEQDNTDIDVENSIENLTRLKADGKPVFVVEYLSDPTKKAEVLAKSRALGFVPTIATRKLDEPPTLP